MRSGRYGGGGGRGVAEVAVSNSLWKGAGVAGQPGSKDAIKLQASRNTNCVALWKAAWVARVRLAVAAARLTVTRCTKH